MKLRNLILSLFLAAGVAAFAACDGTTGPAGVAGGAGPAGPSGPAGDAGKAGDSADEVMRSYAYLKVWGKPEGKAACNDPVLKSPDDTFPGPATLKKLATPVTKYLLTASSDLGDADADPIAPQEGKCSDAVYAAFTGSGVPPDSAAFKFTLTHGNNTNDMTETKTGGTTPTLGNRTVTVVRKQFREGNVEVQFAQGADELAERDLLFTRCDIPNGLTGSTLKGKYRVVRITETEYLLKTVGDFTDRDNATGVSKITKKVCVRFSAPGAVKCYITETTQKRRTSDDRDAGRAEDVTTDQIVLYKDGKLTQVAPMPDSKTNLVPGGTTPGTNADLFATGFGLKAPAKLCNFFAGGVIGTKAVASAVGPASTGGNVNTQGNCTGTTNPSRPNGTWTPASGGTPGSCACTAIANSEPNPGTGMCRCVGTRTWKANPDPRDSSFGCYP